MAIIKQGVPRRVLIGSVLLLSPFVWAAQSTPTATVQGRAPVAAPSITGTAAIGGTLTGASGFADADGDNESGTTYSWSGGGASGSTQTLVVPLAAGANTITLTVTPKTDATITDPAEGVAKTVTVDIPADFGGGSMTDTVLRTWSEANDHCTNKGARLPTKIELENLFLSATSATVLGPVNIEMCSVHGWPLFGQCGGSSNNYWSSTPSGPGSHYIVGLDNGIAIYSTYDRYTFQVACVR